MRHEAVVADQPDASERTPLAEDDAFDGRGSVVGWAGNRQFVEGAPG